jgi:hypothetical protein
MTPDVQNRIAILRQKLLDDTATLEEYKEAILLMRQGRQAAATASAASKTRKAAAAIPSADDMLAELNDL